MPIERADLHTVSPGPHVVVIRQAHRMAVARPERYVRHKQPAQSLHLRIQTWL